MAPAEDVWLVDHALSFAEVGDAVAAMRAYPDLLLRIAGILEVACEDAAMPADVTAAPADAADSTPCEGAAAEDGVTARHDSSTAGDAAASAAEAQEGRAGDGVDALMRQVVGRLHEVVYEVVFQESAGGQPSTRKHRRAHLSGASHGLGPSWAMPCCQRSQYRRVPANAPRLESQACLISSVHLQA